jgi:oligopeptide transport system permease protein
MGRSLSRQILVRLLHFLISLLALIGLCLGLLRFFPGGPFSQEESLDPLVVSELRRFYRLDEDLLTQFWNYIGRISTGDFGTSMHFVGRSVRSLIWEFGQMTLLLGMAAFICALIFAVVFTLVTRNQGLEKSADRLLLLGLSIPSFALGPFLIWFFGFYLDWLPVARLESALGYILPILLLSFKPAIILSRILSSSLDAALQEPSVRTLRALGFSEKSILGKWALKNAWIAFVAQVSPIIGTLISGSILVEVLFSIPGLGFQFVDSVLNRDWPLILGLAVFYGSILLLVQLVTDLICVKLDPRVQSL